MGGPEADYKFATIGKNMSFLLVKCSSDGGVNKDKMIEYVDVE